MELLNNKNSRRLVLGFDAGCGMCSDLASRIAERVGDRVEVRSLHHPQIEHWRKQTLGEGAPWTPTLFEIGGVRGVRAWTGAGMAVRLARVLGLVSTWRVMQALGEVGGQNASVAAVGETSIAGMTTAGMSRGQFLKGIGGAAIAFGFLSGVASPAQAAKNELDYDGLVEAFSAIEEIPNSVIKRGDRAVKQWLRRRLKVDAQPDTRQLRAFNAGKCALAIGKALLLNYFLVSKILKIRAAIKAAGGVAKFVSKFRAAFLSARKRGLSKPTAIRAAAVTAAAAIPGAANAILDLFDLRDVYYNCF